MALVAACEGAAAHPGLAVPLVDRLLTDDPDLAADCGPALLGALLRQSDYAAALAFVQSAPEARRGGWLATVFTTWAEHDPAVGGPLAASYATEHVAGPAWRNLISAWAAGAPRQAMTFAMGLPPGPARDQAFHDALSAWVRRDPLALARRLPAIGDPAERNAAAFALVNATDRANRPTATALQWAQMITDPAERATALQKVLVEWAADDPVAACAYADACPDLTATQRAAILALAARSFAPDRP